MDLKNLRTDLWLSIELEHKSWIGFSHNAQVQLCRRALFVPLDTDPTQVNITCPCLYCVEIHLNCNRPQQLPTIQTTRDTSPPCVDLNLQDRVVPLIRVKQAARERSWESGWLSRATRGIVAYWVGKFLSLILQKHGKAEGCTPEKEGFSAYVSFPFSIFFFFLSSS
ncbi:hypothetical protein CIPAW_15G167200 [Carya illinoinensis]|uniref:Uncharacterized protein n=1 Tax=Carya illinoinensis TaxID=32201 RepID=A0A8T1NGC6_CARIL|nr:hypothetical protein CIPAW_15G167200 [Carya illinoinensis]